MPDRRGRTWADTILSTVITTGAVTGNNLLVDAPTVDTLTVQRIVGHLQILPADGFESVNSSMRIDLGIGVSSAEAFAANVLPDPDVVTEYPPRGWLWVDSVAYYHGVADGDPRHYPEVKIDIRAARRVDKGVLFFAFRNTLVQNTTATVLMIGRIRVLCLT